MDTITFRHRNFAIWRHDDKSEWITICKTGRAMPDSRASGLTRDEREHARNGDLVVIHGCPPYRDGTTIRQVVYRRGRYRTRKPCAEVVSEVTKALRPSPDLDLTWMPDWREKWDTETCVQKVIEYLPDLKSSGALGLVDETWEKAGVGDGEPTDGERPLSVGAVGS